MAVKFTRYVKESFAHKAQIKYHTMYYIKHIKHICIYGMKTCTSYSTPRRLRAGQVYGEYNNSKLDRFRAIPGPLHTRIFVTLKHWC